MTQEEFNAWITAQGGPQAVQFKNENKTVPNPAKQDPASKLDDTIPPTITVNVQTWANPKTGAVLSLAPKGPGQYDVIDQVGPKPASATDPGAAAADANAVELQRQRERNAALPPGQDPAYETDAERRARGRQTVIDQQTAANAKGGGTIVERDGGTYIVKPDGTTIKTDLPASPKPNSSTTVKGEDGKTYVVTVDAQGNVTAKDTGIGPAPAGPPVPASATGWRPDMSKPDLGIFDRRTEVAGQLAAGVFGDPASAQAQQKANDLLKQDLDFAKTAATNVAGIQQGEAGIYSGQISQRSQDVQQADTRTTAAASIYNNALSQLAALAPFMKEHSKNAGALFDDMLAKGYAFQQKMGGQFTPPTVQPGPYMSRTADIFKPGGAASAPLGAPPVAPGATPAARAGPAAPLTQPGWVAPPTGAPRTAPATQGPFAPAAVPPMSQQPRDTTGPGYPGSMPAPQTPMGPLPAQPDLSPTTDASTFWQPPGVPQAPAMPEGQDPTVTWQASPAIAALQQQPIVQGGVMDWAQQMGGWSPGALAAFAQMNGQGGQPV